MTAAQAMTEVFLTAFEALPHTTQELFFLKILKNIRLREDLIDLAIAESRKHEKAKPFSDVVAGIKSRRNS